MLVLSHALAPQPPPPPPPIACQDRYTIPAVQGEEKQGERKGWGWVTGGFGVK
jgi:hypothetical protein